MGDFGERARRGAAAAITAIAVATAASEARGQTPSQAGFAVSTFAPAARGSDWFVLDSLDLRDDGRPAVGVVADYADKPFVAKNASGSDRAAIVAHQLYVHPGGSLVILDRLRLAVDIPVAVVDTGSAAALRGYSFTPPSQAALGDTSFAADVRLFGRYGAVATGALGLEVVAPSGSRAQYAGDGTTRLVPRLQAAGVFRELTWALRIGMIFRAADAPIAGESRGHAFLFGGSLGWRPQQGRLVVGPEIYGSASVTSPSPANTPLEALLGAHYSLSPTREWRVGLGVGPGLTTAIGTPALRATLSLEFVARADDDRPKVAAPRDDGPSDRDHDSVPDTLDACPDKAGPASVDASINGCPPPPDTDGDGIPDTVDACVDEKGSPSADPELNGCPPDADNDGVPDAADACPLRAGVEQADPKQNGCPPDSDRDGIIDADDACPDVPGAPSKDPQDNGCPFDPDRDHDGIPNEADACPHEAGGADADPKKNGCPKAFLRGAEIQLLEPVAFVANGARLADGPKERSGKDGGGASALLRAVAKIMIEHPEIKKLEVQGHTDNRGDAKANLHLSAQRAEAVVKWLVAQGLPASRFTAVGYGDARPIADNGTEDGRKANRRIELHAIELEKSP